MIKEIKTKKIKWAFLIIAGVIWPFLLFAVIDLLWVRGGLARDLLSILDLILLVGGPIAILIGMLKILPQEMNIKSKWIIASIVTVVIVLIEFPLFIAFLFWFHLLIGGSW